MRETNRRRGELEGVGLREGTEKWGGSDGEKNGRGMRLTNGRGGCGKTGWKRQRNGGTR
jgi:hypothetical protein